MIDNIFKPKFDVNYHLFAFSNHMDISVFRHATGENNQ